MARTVKEQEYAGKRNSILDVVQKLVETKGYEQMAIQDILDDLQISKGAFYHYFDSKQALLEALIERMCHEMEQLLLPIVHDPQLPALDKLRRFFAALNRWKTARKEFMLKLLQVWYTDGNALIRQKVRAISAQRLTPLLTLIIQQGEQEGVLTIPYPDLVGGVVLSLMLELSDTLAGLLLSFDSRRDDLLHIERVVAVYSDTFERVLGAPKDSLLLIDAQMLKAWFVSARDAT